MIKVNGEEYNWEKGMTVADLVRELDDPFPYAVIRIDDRHVPKSDYEKTLIPNNSQVYLIQTVAGG